MLKTKRGSQVWLITQPAHAELAGKMAAHWGNEEFAVPGHFAASVDPERLRREVVLAVAEHDNGWWEWEADPPLSVEDGLPQDLVPLIFDFFKKSLVIWGHRGLERCAVRTASPSRGSRRLFSST